MKTLCAALSCMVSLGAAVFSSAAAENQPPAEGAALPPITMTAPKDADQQAYLGLSGQKDFTVADITAEVVIIEIFNMY